MPFHRSAPTTAAARPGVPLLAKGDPRRVWLEELLGPALPRRGAQREDALRELLVDGSDAAWQRLRRDFARH